jgi:hypothetical protein
VLVITSAPSADYVVPLSARLCARKVLHVAVTHHELNRTLHVIRETARESYGQMKEDSVVESGSPTHAAARLCAEAITTFSNAADTRKKIMLGRQPTATMAQQQPNLGLGGLANIGGGLGYPELALLSSLGAHGLGMGNMGSGMGQMPAYGQPDGQPKPADQDEQRQSRGGGRTRSGGDSRSSSAYASRHQAAEQRRRTRINERCGGLDYDDLSATVCRTERKLLYTRCPP